MTTFRRIALSLVTIMLISSGGAGASWADEPRSDVIGQADIQNTIDRHVRNESADRQAVQDFLARPDVGRIAGAAGLDIQRASAAAGVLSGPELQDVAARAHEVTGAVGGSETVTLSVTAIIIILLLIIILAN